MKKKRDKYRAVVRHTEGFKRNIFVIQKRYTFLWVDIWLDTDIQARDGANIRYQTSKLNKEYLHGKKT